MGKPNYQGMRPKTIPQAVRSLHDALQSAQLVSRVVHDMNIVVLMVIHDKFNFGPVLLKRVYDLLLEEWDAVENKYVSIKDMEETLYEELGQPEWLAPK